MTDVPALNIKELHKTFGQDEVLKGISLEARKGDVISIIGSSGSEKVPFLDASIYLKHQPLVIFGSMVNSFK